MKYKIGLKFFIAILLLLELCTGALWLFGAFILQFTVIPLILTVWLFVLHVKSYLSIDANRVIEASNLRQQKIISVLLALCASLGAGFLLTLSTVDLQEKHFYDSALGYFVSCFICFVPLLVPIVLYMRLHKKYAEIINGNQK